MSKRVLLLLGVLFAVVGGALALWASSEVEWHIRTGESTSLADRDTWTIQNQTVGLAIPWSYDLGFLPEGTTFDFQLYLTTPLDVIWATEDGRPLPERYSLIDINTGEVLKRQDARFDSAASPTVIPPSHPFYVTARSSNYVFKVECLLEQEEDLNPVEFSICLVAYRYIKTYPYRLPGAALAVLGIALIVFSRMKTS